MLAAFLLGLGLSSFYTLPVFSEMKYTNVLSQIGSTADFHNHFVCLSQLWQSPWGYGGSAKGCVDGVSFMIGKIHILLTGVALLLIPFVLGRYKREAVVLFIGLGGAILAIFLMLPNSGSIWERIPQMAFIQYPWRYLLLVSFFTSLLGGVSIWTLSLFFRKVSIIVFVGVVLGIVVFSSKYFIPQAFTIRSIADYTTVKEMQWRISRISDEYMPVGFVKPTTQKQLPQSPVSLSNPGKVYFTLNKTGRKDISVNVTKPSFMYLAIAPFPAWKASLDEISIQITYINTGIEIAIPSGSHSVVVKYVQTPIEIFANILSLSSIALCFIAIIVSTNKKKLWIKK
jgi:hypothetical protein